MSGIPGRRYEVGDIGIVRSLNYEHWQSDTTLTLQLDSGVLYIQRLHVRGLVDFRVWVYVRGRELPGADALGEKNVELLERAVLRLWKTEVGPSSDKS